MFAQPLPNEESTPSYLSCMGRCLNVGAIGALSAVSVLLFVQLQAVSMRVAYEQRQIDELREQIESSNVEITQRVEKQKDLTIINIAGTFTLLSCVVTMFHMTAHLRKMNQPFVQRKILAILWMSPIYGVTSFLSLVLPPSAEPYLGILKDFYESYVIYQFLSFLIAVMGRGDRGAVVASLAHHVDHLKPPFKCLYCMFHPRPEESDEAMANAVLLECQFLALQFVFFKPATAIFSFVLEVVNASSDGSEYKNWAYFYSPRFFVILIENISVFLAFSGLLKFYHAVREDLAWCQPFAKFMTIKGVVFVTFWQSLMVNIIFHANDENSKYKRSDDDDSTEDSGSGVYLASYIQHVLICMEMLLFSAAHWCVFPAEEWEDGYKIKFYEGPGFGFKDFASDVNLIIDSGKRSMKAQRERNADAGNASEFGGSNETTTFGSIGETIEDASELRKSRFLV